MILYENFTFDDFWNYEQRDQNQNNTDQRIYAERIRPEDVPHRDKTFPAPQPNKRVIIIDI